MTASPSIPFTGLRGRVLAGLLQLDFVRYHRVQLGFVEHPRQYQQFLEHVVGPRLAELPGRLGVFGVGAHTELALKALPALKDRIHCFTDNNPSLWQQMRLEKPVLPPAQAATVCDVFFLSTAVFQRVLEGDLRGHGFRGPIIAMDDIVPAHWFLAA